jgi:hypothetical protein
MGNKVFKSYKKESRSDWGSTVDENVVLDRDQLKLGAVLRIADSLEKMEQPYLQLIRDVEWYKKRVQNLDAQNDTLRKRVAAYQGVIKRMKNSNS